MKKETTDTQTKATKKAKTLTGKVVSTSMAKTAIIEVTQVRRHPLYRKTMKSTHRHAAHVDGVEVAVGQMVKIAETKPISRTKHFIVTEIVK